MNDLELRNAAAMRAGQARYDNMTPEEPVDPEDWLDEQSALQQAADELAANPASIMFHLGHMVGDDAESVPVQLLMSNEFDPSEHTAGTLLAMLFEGSAENRELARLELRDRLTERTRDDVRRRAQELLAEQDRRLRDERDEWALDRAQEREA